MRGAGGCPRPRAEGQGKASGGTPPSLLPQSLPQALSSPGLAAELLELESQFAGSLAQRPG